MRHRTALITAGSIAAVVFAGAIAVGANLGILTVADSRPVGQLSAATPAATSVVPTSTPKTTQVSAGAKPAAASQTYIIKKAGTVAVTFSKTSVRLVDVTPMRHWVWTLAQSRDRKLTVTFRHQSDTYTFVAVVGRDGKLVARVDHPITTVTPAAPAASSVSWAASPVATAASPSHAGSDQSNHDDGSSHGGEEADD
jgi:hypothetical protein